MPLTKHKEEQSAIVNIVEKHRESLMRIQGIVDLGVGFKIVDRKLTDELAIIIEVINQEQIKKTLPKSIDGIAVSVIESPTPENFFQPSHTIHPKIKEIAAYRNQEFKKLLGGIRIRNGWGKGYGSGTLGAIAYDIDTNEPFGITSRHVLLADRIWQSRKEFPVIHPDKKWSSDTEIGMVIKEGDTSFDCIRFAINPKREIDEENSFVGIEGKIQGIESEIICGTKVMKSGSQTGVTYGIIVSQSVCNKSRFIIFPDEDYNLIDDELTMGGDSGSIWMLNDGSMKAIGLHCLGNKSKQYDAELSVALKLETVANHLNLRF